MNNVSKLVNLEFDDGLAVITIDNPPLNAVNAGVMTDLYEAIEHIERSNEIQAVIITGAGNKAFVAGADITEFPTLDDKSGKALVSKGQKVFNKLENVKVPVICAINGYALGGGCELALVCDIRIAESNAKFGLPEVGLGIIPGYGGTQRLSRLVGLGKAKELIFTGEIISAKEAHQIGLVEMVVPEGEGMEKARKLAQKIMAKGPLAISKAKYAISEGFKCSLEEGLELEANLFAELCNTEDKSEGAVAFMEKRKPNFKGK